MKYKNILVFITLFISIQQIYGNQYSDKYSTKPDGVYVIISGYSCTACLATLLNNLNTLLDEKNIPFEIEFFGKSEFEYSKYKTLFNQDMKFTKLDSSQKFETKYTIKKNDHCIIADLNQKLSTLDILNQALYNQESEKLNIEENDMVFSVKHLTSLNDSISYFSDEFNGNVFTYNKSDNKIKMVDFRLDSLKDNYLDSSCLKLPYTWENGYKSNSDYYYGLTQAMKNLHRINSLSSNNGQMELLFDLITHSNTFLDNSTGVPSLKSEYTSFKYNFSTNHLERTDLHYLQFNYWWDKNYSFYSDNGEWFFGEMQNGRLKEEFFTSPDYLVMLKLENSVIILKKDSVEIFYPHTGLLKSYKLKLYRSNQLIPMKNNDSGIYSITERENTIEIASYKFGNGIYETKYILNKSLLDTDKYLNIINIIELDNKIFFTVLTEEQNIYKISLAD